MFLYQHSPRCTLVLQRFLDENPEYWCLVPMGISEANADDASSAKASSLSNKTARATTTATIACQIESPSPATMVVAAKPMRFATVIGEEVRSNQEAIGLKKSPPKPPVGYRFSKRQVDEHIDFFKNNKESRVMNLVDLYGYAIVAVCKYYTSEHCVLL
jgi:hypothetical protein